jgi:hypothetical protein
MKITAIALGITLVAGLSLAAFRMNASAPVTTVEFDSAGYFDASAATDDRIRALEAAVAQERNARQLLEEELRILFAEIEKLGDAKESVEADDARRVAEVQEARVSFDTARSVRRDRSPEGRRTALISAGFAPDRADWIIRRESELQMQAMQARFDAMRSGEPMNPFNASLNPDSGLRAEMGDIEYEQYLAANGRPTAVHVGSVIESSPGQVAGIRPGDQITRYDGQRVFNTMDLTLQATQGVPGDSVVVEIVRDGVSMQIVLPRGPIGVSTGRFSRRR